MGFFTTNSYYQTIRNKNASGKRDIKSRAKESLEELKGKEKL
jgi:hypothetical protein